MKYSVTQAAQILNISKEAVYNRARRGTLASVKEGGRLYIIMNESSSLPVNADDYNELKTKYLNLLAAYEALKLININEPINIKPSKPKWLLLKDYLKRFKKPKRKKVKKYLLKRLDKSSKIKLEDGQIYVKNTKLRKI